MSLKRNNKECKHNRCVVFVIAKADATGRSVFSERLPTSDVDVEDEEEVARRRQFVVGCEIDDGDIKQRLCNITTKRRFTAGRISYKTRNIIIYSRCQSRGTRRAVDTRRALPR